MEEPLPEHIFWFLLSQDAELARRYNHFFSILLVRLEGSEIEDSSLVTISNLIRRVVRQSDDIGIIGKNSVGILLLDPELSHINNIIGRIRESIRGRYDRVHIGLYPDDDLTLSGLTRSALTLSESNQRAYALFRLSLECKRALRGSYFFSIVVIKLSKSPLEAEGALDVATLFSVVFRQSDFIGKIGDNTFMVILRHAEEDNANEIMGRIRDRLQETRLNPEDARIGRASFPTDGGTADGLLSIAQA